ncbi:hypothetical protein V7659_24910, partial [Neobacillus drentensis]|uniref:DUF5724 domain-containing protein n=1 Tax=Neobacillus drentensis TaxID=220684 RepID=UPI002FFF9AC7
MRTKNKELYYEGLAARASQELNGTEQQLALLILKLENATYLVRDTNHQEIRKIILGQESHKDPIIYQPLVKIARTLLGNRYGTIFQYIVDRKCEYPYSIGFDRRPFRTKNLEFHHDGLIDSFLYLVDLAFEEFSIIEYLTTRDNLSIY